MKVRELLYEEHSEEHPEYLFCIKWFNDHSDIKQVVFDLVATNRSIEAIKIIMKKDPSLSVDDADMLTDFAFHEANS